MDSHGIGGGHVVPAAGGARAYRAVPCVEDGEPVEVRVFDPDGASLLAPNENGHGRGTGGSTAARRVRAS
jgi:hypothetical protein